MYEDASSYVEIEAFVDELARAGVRHACISPGARSTPLALSITGHPALRAWSHIDERSGSFFALGIAKTTRSPVAVVCTSGTAAANFFPAIIEAAYAHVPLLILTADRPAELRECGAGQAIDQLKLYGNHVKWFVEVGTAEAGWRYFRALGCRAAETACAMPPGPVHVNFPFREPLVPVSAAENGPVSEAGGHVAATARLDGEPYTRLREGERLPAPSTVSELARCLAAAPRGVIACGPYDSDRGQCTAITGLAAALGYPILADATSQLRNGEHDTHLVVCTYDVMLRAAPFAERVRPEIVLRIGPMPASKALAGWLRGCADCRQIVIDPFGPWNDPLQMAAEIVRCDPAPTCDAVRGELAVLDAPHRPRPDEAWLATWLDADRRARRVLAETAAGMGELFEGRVFAELGDLLPHGASLYVGNSMPVRDIEVFWPSGARAVRILCNRGANGIDGFISSGLGAAAVSDDPVVVVTGDLGLYHDLNGLLAAKRYGVRATIIVLNNDGGGIFSYLPQAECGDAFEEYFLTPHGLDFRGAVEMYGCAFERVSSWEQFRRAVNTSMGAANTTVIEVPIDRARSVALHREIWAAAGRAAAEA